MTSKIRLRQPRNKTFQLCGSGLGRLPYQSKLGLEADPEQQVITTMQVHQGDQPRLPPSCIASLACVCMMAACLLLTTTRTLKFYICTDVPHTHTHPAAAGFIFRKKRQLPGYGTESSVTPIRSASIMIPELLSTRR